MFKELEGLSKVLKLDVSIQAKGDQMSAVVILRSLDNDTDLKLTPIFVKATPEELDAKFAETVDAYTKKNLDTLERINFISQSVAKAEKIVTAKAKVDTKKATTPVKKKEEKKAEPDMFSTVAPITSSKAKTKTASGKATVTGTLTSSTISDEEQEAIEESMTVPQQKTIEEDLEDLSKAVEKTTDMTQQLLDKVEKPKEAVAPKKAEINPATQPKDLGEAKKKAQGQPFINRRGVLVNLDGTIHTPKPTIVDGEGNHVTDVIPNTPLPTPTILGAESAEEEAEVMKALQDAGIAPAPPVPTPPIVSGVIIPPVEPAEPTFESFNVEDFQEAIKDPKQVLFDEVSAMATEHNIQLKGFTFESQTIETLTKLKPVLINHINSKK